MMVSPPLLLVGQARRLLHPLVLFLLAVAAEVVALLLVLLAGLAVQAVAVVRPLLVVEELLRRQVKVTPVDHMVGRLFLVVEEVEQARLAIPTVRVKVEMELHLLLQEHR